MTCETLRDGDGRPIGFMCGRGRKSKPCAYCGRQSSRLCDFALTGPKAGQTCDVPMCANCTWSPRVEKDYCRPHRTIMTRPAVHLAGEPQGRLQLCSRCGFVLTDYSGAMGIGDWSPHWWSGAVEVTPGNPTQFVATASEPTCLEPA